jgi:protein-L-isoaspartate(D-aspartate) O-methyltransferase
MKMRRLAGILIISVSLFGCQTQPGSQPTPLVTSPISTNLTQITESPIIKDPTATIFPIESEDHYKEARGRLVRTGIVGWGIEDERVIKVMGEVPRHEFVPPEYLNQAYDNNALPIGYGQTISQPFIVALMTQELDVSEGDRVLEIGTGSGYQAAVLAHLGVDVYTIEIISPLYEEASERLSRLGYTHITTRHADGYYGWEEESPFDAIIVTAAPDHVPQPLLAQLKIGGVMVIPVGPVGAFQELWKITRVDEDSYQSTSLGGVRFVPFTRMDESQ